jgi:hypothetical protein
MRVHLQRREGLQRDELQRWRLLPPRVCARQTDHDEQHRAGLLLLLPDWPGAAAVLDDQDPAAMPTAVLPLEWHVHGPTAAASTAAAAATVRLVHDRGDVHSARERDALHLERHDSHVRASTAAATTATAAAVQRLHERDVPHVARRRVVARPMHLEREFLARQLPEPPALCARKPHQAYGQARRHGLRLGGVDAGALEGPARAIRLCAYRVRPAGRLRIGRWAAGVGEHDPLAELVP